MPSATRRTKIVATLGPASEGEDKLRALLEAGVEVVRLNLAHGPAEAHLDRMAQVRRLSGELGRPVAVLCDLPGPKIRTTQFPEGGVFLPEGGRVELIAAEGDGPPSDEHRIAVGYADLCADVRVGDHVSLGDGGLVLRVDECQADRAHALVVSGGRLQGRPGVHLPAERLGLSTPTPEDLALLDVVAAAGTDFVAVSFVRDAEDVKEVKAALGPAPHPLVVAKIETRSAVEALESILEITDAVMVARGDLGTDCPIEEVPHLQKRIVRACVEWGKPVITATQMLESMIYSPTPTRAEASDVANAVFDGTDAVMLSGETAIGRDPVHVVRTMARIVARAEQEAGYLAWGSRLGRMQRRAPLPETLAITAATTHAAWAVAVELGAKAVVCCTRTGLTARAMARFRPPCALAGCSYDDLTVRQLTLSWGVRPMRVDRYESTDEMVWFSVEAVVREGLAERGDVVIVLAGAPEDEEPSTDVLRVVRIR